ncbi:MAG: tetratricopeptide repeat protein [Opitutaceae bacterium]
MRPPISSAPIRPKGPDRALIWGFALVAAVVTAYLGVLPGEFLWDDDLHVTANPTIIGPLGLREIWTTAAANYFPLVLTNFWVQHALWGVHPLGYHLVTLACHALSAVLLLRVLRQLNARGAWLGAALWALHPVQVESVAWICELKNTQSAVFFLLAIGFYLRWLKTQEASTPFFTSTYTATGGVKARSTKSHFYVLALLSAVLAILSKPSTVTLPVVLALIMWWLRRRLSWRDLLPLIPFFALSLSAAGWTIWEQRVHSGAEGAAWAQTWPERCAIAGHVVWFYLGKLAWPADLIFIYPRWQIDGADLRVYGPLAAMLLMLGFMWWRRDSALRPVFAAAIFFGAMLFPVLGFFNIYFFRYSFVGDHFQYLASMGPLALAGAGLTVALERLPSAWVRLHKIGPAVLLTVLGVLTWRESLEYLSHESLWRATLARNPSAAMAWFNLGDTLAKKGRHDEAIASFRRALELRPNDAPGHNDLACELVVIGQPLAALPLFERALLLRPGYAEVYNNLGNALRSLGRIAEATAQYEKALAAKPDYAEAHNNLACELSAQGRLAEALTHFEIAIRLQPEHATAHGNRANILRDIGRLPEALSSYERALQLDPKSAEIVANYALALAAAGRTSEALARFSAAAQFNPASPKIRRDWGTTLARTGRQAEAIVQFEELIRLDPRAPAAYATLGNAFALAGRWADAARTFRTGLQVTPDDADLHCNLAVALASSGQLNAAADEFSQALKLRPAFIEAHENLAQILRQLGRSLEAVDHYDEAERLKLQSTRATSIRP